MWIEGRKVPKCRWWDAEFEKMRRKARRTENNGENLELCGHAQSLSSRCFSHKASRQRL
jgi:hypothetical protein